MKVVCVCYFSEHGLGFAASNLPLGMLAWFPTEYSHVGQGMRGGNVETLGIVSQFIHLLVG